MAEPPKPPRNPSPPGTPGPPRSPSGQTTPKENSAGKTSAEAPTGSSHHQDDKHAAFRSDGQKPNCQIVIVGTNGTGKTCRARDRARQLVGLGWTTIIHDSNEDDYPGFGWLTHSPRDLGRWCGMYVDAQRNQRPIVPSVRYTGDPMEMVQIARQFSNRGERPTVVCLEESGAYQSNRKIDDVLKEVQARRRHFGLGLIYVCQDPSQVHHTTFSMATEIDCFRVVSKNGVKLLGERGVHPEVAASLPELDNYHFTTVTAGAKLESEPDVDDEPDEEPQ